MPSDQRAAVIALLVSLMLASVVWVHDPGTDTVQVPATERDFSAISFYIPPDQRVPGQSPAPSPEEPPKVCPGPSPQAPRVDVVLCVDATGSMHDEMESLRNAVARVIEGVLEGAPEPEVRYGLVAYRDEGCDFVTRAWDFMGPEALLEALSTVEAAQGGDYPEAVTEALWASVQEVSWDPGPVSRAVYLIGDATPHEGGDHVAAAEAAAERGIVINAIGCSGILEHEAALQEVATTTGGTFRYLERSFHDIVWIEESEALDDPPANDLSPPRGQGQGQGQPQRCDDNLTELLMELLRGQCASQGVVYPEGGP